MTSIDWSRVRALFEAALKQDPANRDNFLAEVCANDAALRAEVEKLLVAHDCAGDFIEMPAAAFSPSQHEMAIPIDLIGRRIGPYKVLKEIGRGGMGEVFLAARDDGAFKMQVAIKLVRPNIRPEVIARFERERQILAELNHPNIARLLDGGTSVDGRPYVVMEYIDGQSLRELMDSRGALPIDQVISIAVQLCEALDAAHERGVIHRDIKPGNIIISRSKGNPLVKVVDFGIAKLEDLADAGATTETGAIIGTASYMSPEQAAGSKIEKIDSRSDIYSAGMVIYEMLTGRVAFEGDSWHEVLSKHLNQQPPPPGSIRPDLKIPKRIERVVLKALAKDRNHRQQNIQQLADELRDPQRQSESSYGSIKPRLRMKKTPLILVILILLGALTAILSYSSLLTPKPKPILCRVYKSAGRDAPIRVVRPGEALQTNESLYFEFEIPFRSKVYFLYENSDGSMVWGNPQKEGEAQIAEIGNWLAVPDRYGRLLDDKDGIMPYLLIFAPIENGWSINEATYPGGISFKRGRLEREGREIYVPYAEIAPRPASMILNFLKTDGKEIKLEPLSDGMTRSGNVPARENGNNVYYARVPLVQKTR